VSLRASGTVSVACQSVSSSSWAKCKISSLKWSIIAEWDVGLQEAQLLLTCRPTLTSTNVFARGYNLVKVVWWSTQSFGHNTSTWQTDRQPRRHSKCRPNAMCRPAKTVQYCLSRLRVYYVRQHWSVRPHAASVWPCLSRWPWTQSQGRWPRSKVTGRHTAVDCTSGWPLHVRTYNIVQMI